MSEVKWIKICTDIFDDEKILLIESMPEADAIIVIWFKLLCMAGKQNNSGVFMLNEKIAYTDEMLATIFRRPVNIVRLALNIFEQYGMIEIIDGAITVPNWEKHQSIDKMQILKEQNRKRVANFREKQKKLLIGDSVCQYCGGKATGIDHIIPLSRGGLDIEENTIPCCIECNRIKNNKPLVDFLNNNRDRIRDDLIKKNPKLNKVVMLCNVTDHYKVMQCNETEEEKEEEKEKEFHSFYQSGGKMEFMGGKLGKGVVLLSAEQEEDLLNRLSLDEFNKYVSIIADCELAGKKFKKKSHYQAILDMVEKDRKIKKE